MKQKYLLFISLLFVAAIAKVQAAEILFAHVDNNTSYVDDGDRIAQFLVNDGHSVTTRFLDSAVYSDWSDFDQIFVYDLYTGANTNAYQASNYAGIAGWYNSLTDQNLILDGRIISSDVTWSNANNMSSEEAWIQNYATQLDLRGGGLMLGTDHYPYQSGINSINQQIGVSPFTGMFGSYPSSQAVVDENSPLFINGLDTCRADATTFCINDNSTTGFVATGLQANGQTLTPVAYHGSNIDAWSYAAVSATFGSETFGTCGTPGYPPCDVTPVSEPYSFVLFMIGLAGVAYRRKQMK